LQQSEELFRRLSTCFPIGIFTTDVSGVCTYTNPRFQQIYETENTINWLDKIHPEEQQTTTKEWEIALKLGNPYSREFRIISSQQTEQWIYLSSAPLYTDTGQITGCVAIVEDITERKQAQQKQIELVREQTIRKEAETANRLKDEFIAILSHKLRTPLNAIFGWAKLLRSHKLEPSVIEKALETIERNATLQTQLIDDILDISRIMHGKLRLNLSPVDLILVIAAVIDTFELEAQAKNIQLEFAQHPQKVNISLPQFIVAGDCSRLQQIIWNLVSNAIKFTKSGGIVEILLEKTESQQAKIIIKDTGIGIKPEFLPFVFDRFRQADSSTTRHHGGLGLGLAIVRYLVEIHHGTINAESLGEDQGSTFTVQLPLLK
jgi:PAS domain S-box-containing protein